MADNLGMILLAGTALACLAGCGGGNAGVEAAASATSSAIAAAPPTGSEQAPSPEPSPKPDGPTADTMLLGSTTHFDQGWTIDALDKAEALSIDFLRDGLDWRQGEEVKGKIDFTGGTARKLDKTCDSGVKLLLTQIPINPNYDDGRFVYSPEARAAFAKYVRALADRYGSCILAFEIGNEINGGGDLGLKYPDGYDLEDTYIALLKDIRTAMGDSHPDIRILGGSTNMIGTGYLEKFFEAGMLDYVDGVSVHPYQGYASGIDLEIAALREAMRANGGEVEIWAAEFAHDHEDQKLAASEGIKSITMMAAANIDAAIWYALLEEKWFPNLGLWDGDTLKQQGRAVRLALTKLLPHGNPVKLELGDPGLYAYHYGTGATVIWGTPRTIRVSGVAGAYDAFGNNLKLTGEFAVSDSPIVLIGGEIEDVGQSDMLADTLLQYGSGAWKYYARGKDGSLDPLTYKTQWYTSAYGSAWDGMIALGPNAGVPARGADDPIRVLWQWETAAPGPVTVKACFRKRYDKGDGIDLAIERNGTPVATQVLATGETILTADIDLAARDKVMISAGPNQTWGSDDFYFRARIYRQGAGGTVKCP